MRKTKMNELYALIEELKTNELNLTEKPPRFISSEVYSCSLNNGKTITREKLIKGKKDGSASIILPLTSDNNVLLIVEPRVFTKRTVGIGLVAGYIEPGEAPETAAKRELFEETGYVSDDLIHLGGFYQDMGCSAAYNECFMAKNCIKADCQHLDNGEYIRFFECSFDEAIELMENGYIEDCNAIITLEKAKRIFKA